MDHTHRTELQPGAQPRPHLLQVDREYLSKPQHFALNPRHLADLAHSLPVGAISDDQHPGPLSGRAGLKNRLDGVGSAPLEQHCGPCRGGNPGNVQQTLLNVCNSLDELFVSGAEVSQHGGLDGVGAAQGTGSKQLLIWQLLTSENISE